DTVVYALEVVTKHPVTGGFLDLAWSAKTTKHPQWKPLNKVERLFTNLKICTTHNSEGNYYSPSDDYINIVGKEHWYATGGNTVEYRHYRTMCHELVHWTGHRSRLNRLADINKWGGPAYAVEELTAELGACMLMKVLGYSNENTNFHAEYFQHWLQRAGDKDEAIKLAAERAKKA